MSDLLTCEFNIDTACVELCFADGSMISIDCTAVENEVADNMYQRSELDYLIYNDPVAYANLILNGDPETYLKTVTEYNPLDCHRFSLVSKGMRNARTDGFLGEYLFSNDNFYCLTDSVIGAIL